MCDKNRCTCKKKSGRVDPATLQKMECEFAKFLQTDSRSLVKKYLTQEMFDKLKTRKTKLGASLLDCVQTVFKNPDSHIGIYAADPECYKVFGPLFDVIIEDYHGFKRTDSHPASCWGNPAKIQRLDPDDKYIISTRVRIARSIDGYPFNPMLTKNMYCELQDQMCSALTSLEGEFRGDYHRLDGMDKAFQQKMIDDHFLFKEGDRFLQDGNACRYWPFGRGIFFNKDKTLLSWVCEEDHMRLISMQMGGDLSMVYGRLMCCIQKLERQLTFAHHERFGYLTMCPTNLGTTIRASVHIKLPKLSSDMKKFEEIAGIYNLQVRGTRGEHTESEGGVYDVSNKRRLGLTENEVILEMANGITELIKREETM